jgi:hypothetical protein
MVSIQGGRPTWRQGVHESLYTLLTARAQPLLRARPPSWDEVSVALVADLPGLHIQDADALGPPLPDMEDSTICRLLQHFHGHIHSMVTRSMRGSSDRRLELCLMETPEAQAAQIGAVDGHPLVFRHQVLLPQTPTEPALRIPVRLGPGQVINPHCGSIILVHVMVRGLPAGPCREGLGRVLLDSAGCSTTEYSVDGEFLGDLPSRIAACPAAIQVSNSDACLLFIRAPAADRRLSRLPRYFTFGQERVHISRPGQPRQPSSHGLQPQDPIHQPEDPTHHLEDRRGHQAIRLRHRAAAATRAAQLGQGSSWTSAARCCKLWRPTCAAAGHQEWTAGAWAALCPSPCLRPPPLRASFQQQTPQHRWTLSLPTAVSHIPLPTQWQPWRSTRRHHIPSLPWTVMNPPPCQRAPLPGHSYGQLCRECPPASSSPFSAGSTLTQTLTPSRSRHLSSASTRSSLGTCMAARTRLRFGCTSCSYCLCAS